MAENWETDDLKVASVKDNWEDEDDDNVKDAWDEEEEPSPPPQKTESKKATTTTTTTATTSKPVKEMTEEEKKEAQMKADLAHTTELFGLEKSLDEFSIDSKEEYKDFVNRINARLSTLTKKPLYLEFVDELFKSLCQPLTGDQVKKLSISVKTISDNKLVEEKSNKQKDVKAKAKTKAPKIKLEANRIKGDFDEFLKDSHRTYDEDDDDDFM